MYLTLGMGVRGGGGDVVDGGDEEEEETAWKELNEGMNLFLLLVSTNSTFTNQSE